MNLISEMPKEVIVSRRVFNSIQWYRKVSERELESLRLANRRSFSRAVLVERLWEKAYCSRFKRKIGNDVENTVCRRSLLMTERRETGAGGGGSRWEISSLVLFSPSQEEKWIAVEPRQMREKIKRAGSHMRYKG